MLTEEQVFQLGAEAMLSHVVAWLVIQGENSAAFKLLNFSSFPKFQIPQKDVIRETLYNKGWTLEWGKDLSEETKVALKNREIFTLLDKEGKPYSLILMDSFRQLREQKP